MHKQRNAIACQLDAILDWQERGESLASAIFQFFRLEAALEFQKQSAFAGCVLDDEWIQNYITDPQAALKKLEILLVSKIHNTITNHYDKGDISDNLHRLSWTVWAYRHGKIASDIGIGLPNTPGMDSANCIASVLCGDFEVKDGMFIIPDRSDVLQAGRRWLSRLRFRMSQQGSEYEAAIDADDWDSLIPSLLNLLPLDRGRPRANLN